MKKIVLISQNASPGLLIFRKDFIEYFSLDAAVQKWLDIYEMSNNA